MNQTQGNGAPGSGTRNAPSERHLAWPIVAGLLVACEAPIAPPEPTPPHQDPIEDHEGPLLDTIPITAPQSLDTPILFEATAEDPSGVYAVLLHYKPQNTEWQTLRMDEVSDNDGYFYTELNAEDLPGAGSISYYLEAADATPYRNASFSPTTGSENPYRFNLESY